MPDTDHPPAITSTPPGPAVVGEDYQYQVLANDPDGDKLTYSLLSGPHDMRFDPDQPNLLEWTPDFAATALPAAVEAVIEASDSRGGTASQRSDVRHPDFVAAQELKASANGVLGS